MQKTFRHCGQTISRFPLLQELWLQIADNETDKHLASCMLGLQTIERLSSLRLMVKKKAILKN